MHLFALVCAVAALIAAACASPAAIHVIPDDFAASPDAGTGVFMSDSQLAHWLATTDAKLTFVGGRPDLTPLARRAAQNTIVTYCSTRIGPLCTGECTVYNGGPECVDVPHTECMAATKDVGYCDKKGCKGNCNELAACGTKMLNGFCFTYGTKSIVVSTL